ncbi:NADH dehydrogenase (ubiquinone) complex I, assembly factor 6 isoform X2 [Agrilus planipennis]|uniref:NADH dehydrogenase (Ubiquinone) complex I, assembly factor 6 isoform X2 n=1 Tax=Agrilus planipennis TaxID=224129 RepID=A0A7F5QWR0_AGRPL|nr:NADH dehydrogenase (ubiquinone) complex I, assembly factor 6 isoform X2 [Agrilus planipennis]
MYHSILLQYNFTKLSKHHFLNLISCRKQYLPQNYFNNLEDLEKYAEKSMSSVYYLIFEGMDIRNIHADHAASHLGKAQGITQQLRIAPFAKQLNTIPIPQDLLIKHNLSQEDILRGKSSKNLKECVYEIASRAYQHLMKARSLLQKVPAKGRDALLPAVPVYNYLDRLQKVDYEILHPDLQKKSRMWLFHLWISHFQNKY